MPAAYARTATQALTNVTQPYIEALADFGAVDACQAQAGAVGRTELHEWRANLRGCGKRAWFASHEAAVLRVDAARNREK